MTFHSRADWGAAPAKGGPGSLTPSRVKGVVLHWPGSGETDSFDNDAEVASALRGWQRFHQQNRGWSDIAYQRAFSQDGDVWELRGLRTQSGANGNSELNEIYGAFLLILVAGEEPSAAMKAAVRASVAEFRRIYGDDAALIKPHSAVRPDGTDCPGPKARAAITRGDFEPWADQPDTPDTEDDMPLNDADKLWIEKNNQKYANAVNTFVRQSLGNTARALVAADKASDKAEADRIIAALDDESAALSAQILADAAAEQGPTS